MRPSVAKSLSTIFKTTISWRSHTGHLEQQAYFVLRRRFVVGLWRFHDLVWLFLIRNYPSGLKTFTQFHSSKFCSNLWIHEIFSLALFRFCDAYLFAFLFLRFEGGFLLFSFWQPKWPSAVLISLFVHPNSTRQRKSKTTKTRLCETKKE